MPMSAKPVLLVLTLAAAAGPHRAMAEPAGGSILEQVLTAFGSQYDLDGEEVSIFVNFAQNYDTARGGQFVSGAIMSDAAQPVMGVGGVQTVPEPRMTPATGTLATNVMGSSNTGIIEVGLPEAAPLMPFNGATLAGAPLAGSAGTTSFMLNGSANSISINGSVVVQPNAVPQGPGGISTSAMGAVNFGANKLVSSGQSGLYLVGSATGAGLGVGQ